MYRQHRLREIGLRRGVSRDKNGLRRGLAGLNRTWTFDPCTPCLKFCTPTFKILPNSLLELHRPVPNKAIGAAAFGFAGPDRWNKLPERLRESASLNIFKRDLKTHLFNNTF